MGDVHTQHCSPPPTQPRPSQAQPLRQPHVLSGFQSPRHLSQHQRISESKFCVCTRTLAPGSRDPVPLTRNRSSCFASPAPGRESFLVLASVSGSPGVVCKGSGAWGDPQLHSWRALEERTPPPLLSRESPECGSGGIVLHYAFEG
jgi:hypothetical protein